MKQSALQQKTAKAQLRLFLIPCSCGLSFVVSGGYARTGTSWSRYLICPSCGKRHDPKNWLIELGYHSEGFWKVDKC